MVAAAIRGIAIGALCALVGVGVAFAASPEEFIAACQNSTNLDERVCGCCAAKAEAQLAPPAFDFVVASMNQDREKTAELRQKLSIEEAVQASMFMVNTPERCARELGQP